MHEGGSPRAVRGTRKEASVIFRSRGVALGGRPTAIRPRRSAFPRGGETVACSFVVVGMENGKLESRRSEGLGRVLPTRGEERGPDGWMGECALDVESTK